jgi:hypothetical protein
MVPISPLGGLYEKDLKPKLGVSQVHETTSVRRALHRAFYINYLLLSYAAKILFS